MRQLKNRLYTVSTLVPKGARVADIGTDHGHLPIYLIKQEISPYCIACDIKEKPLTSAKENIEKTQTPNIELRLGSGLEPLHPEDADCVVIAGMGGEVISGILGGVRWIKDGRYTLILQPMTSADSLRRYLCENGFKIVLEVPCEENRKVYTVIKAVYTGECFTPDEFFCRIGKLTPDTPSGKKYIEKQLKIVKDCIDDRTAAGLSADEYNAVYAELIKALKEF